MNGPTRCGWESLMRAERWKPWEEEVMEKVYEVAHAPNGPSVTPEWRVQVKSVEEDELLIAYCFTKEDAERIAAALNAQPRVRVQ